MKTRMALVAVLESYDGPWQRARGYETGVVVECLEEGGKVLLESKLDGQFNLPIEFTQSGTFPHFPECDSFRFAKNHSENPQKTFVKVII